MGIDFIRRATGKPFIKGWKDNLDRLTMPSLFDPVIDAPVRILSARLVTDAKPQPGLDLIAQIRETEVCFYHHLDLIATSETPP